MSTVMIAPLMALVPPARGPLPSLTVPPLMVTPFRTSLSPPSTDRIAPLAVSVKVVPVTVTLSSVSVWPLSTVTPPLLSSALVVTPPVVVPLIELDVLISMVPSSVMMPPVMVVPESVRVLLLLTVSWWLPTEALSISLEPVTWMVPSSVMVPPVMVVPGNGRCPQ